MKKLVSREKIFYGDDGSNEASSFYHKQLKNKKAHNVDMSWSDELNSFIVSWEEAKTVVYVVSIDPYGDLMNEMFPDIVGVYGTFEKALKGALEELNEDISYNGYVVHKGELEEFKNGTSSAIYVYSREVDNTYCYYELGIMEREVK